MPFQFQKCQWEPSHSERSRRKTVNSEKRENWPLYGSYGERSSNLYTEHGWIGAKIDQIRHLSNALFQDTDPNNKDSNFGSTFLWVVFIFIRFIVANFHKDPILIFSFILTWRDFVLLFASNRNSLDCFCHFTTKTTIQFNWPHRIANSNCIRE